MSMSIDLIKYIKCILYYYEINSMSNKLVMKYVIVFSFAVNNYINKKIVEYIILGY